MSTLRFAIAIAFVASAICVPEGHGAPTGFLGAVFGASSGDIQHTKVAVDIYVESLCIDSKNYMASQVLPTFDLLKDIMDLNLVVFGNANIDTSTASVTCQHGPAECDANAYQLCARDAFPFAARYVPFDACLFESLPMGHRDNLFDPKVFADCARQTALDWDAIRDCHNDIDVWELQSDAAAKTPPYHKYVPWVEVNGRHLDEEKEELLLAVCESYHRSLGVYGVLAGPAVCPQGTSAFSSIFWQAVVGGLKIENLNYLQGSVSVAKSFLVLVEKPYKRMAILTMCAVNFCVGGSPSVFAHDV
jgi:interferon, gamma-inducible protein 30